MMLTYQLDSSAISGLSLALPVIEGQSRQNSKSADDGRCTIDIVLNDKASWGKATNQDIQYTAGALVNQCVALSANGGIAMNVGRTISSTLCSRSGRTKDTGEKEALGI